MSISYRRDIDALRGIAVASVVLFHAFPNVFRGGYLGVDIFFIISGFLITSIILQDLSYNQFSFLSFYSRRIKRIFPALICVLLVLLTVGMHVLYPEEYKQLCLHVISAGSFFSNFQLLSESGYFDKSSETKPLLHMWSLAIEEQFYLVWPFIIYLAWRMKKIGHFIFACIIFSFISNIYLSYHSPEKAFYWPLSRFLELAMGGGFAYIQTKPDQKIYSALQSIKSLFGNYLYGTGILLLAGSILFLSPRLTFPGLWIFIPIISTLTLILYQQNKEPINNSRFTKWLVWLGLISYPLYLWHWPILSLLHIMEGHTPSISVRILAIALSILLAFVTYKLIEYPFRYWEGIKWKTTVLIFSMVATVTFAFFSYHSVQSIEPSHFSNNSLSWSKCEDEASTQTYCWIKQPLTPIDTIVIGDSHAGHLGIGLQSAFMHSKHNVLIAWGGDCLPFIQEEKQPYFSSVCDPIFFNKLYEKILASHTIRHVVISNYAIAKIQGKAEALNRSFGYDNNSSESAIEKRANLFRRAMYDTFDKLRLSRKKITYLVDIPELYFDPKECQPRPIELPWHIPQYNCSISRDRFESRNRQYHDLVAEAQVKYPEVKFVNLYQFLCDANYCYAKKSDTLLYGDRDHLNENGSRYLTPYLKQLVMD